MFKKALSVMVLFTLFTFQSALAQSNQNLSSLILNLYGERGLIVDTDAPLAGGVDHSAHFNSSFQSEFGQINNALATQLLSLPLPSPASGFTYTFNPSLGVFTRSTQSFGSILSERAETIGKKRVTFGFNFQHFNFDSFQGVPLNNVPAVFTHDDSVRLGGREDVVTTNSRIELKVDQFTFSSTVGLTDHIDLSVAVPVVRTDLSVVSEAIIQRIGTGGNLPIHYFSTGRPGSPDDYGNRKQFSASGSDQGIGDIIFRVKGTAVKWENSRLAFGADFRVPSGDEKNLLGSGAAGVKPFAAYTYNYKRFSPHFNVGYQWNGKSVLAGDLQKNTKGNLPDQFLYVVGADVGLSSWFSLAIDILGQRVIDSPRLISETFETLVGGVKFPNIRFEQPASFNVNNGAIGFKVNPGGNLLLNFNLLLQLDNGGLRDKIAPLVGATYTF